ncbi:MAG: FAD-dependent oxidoreductase [Propionicimonas sp.]|uniref:oxidoreductase n=1 Tax=Propionicimonas sp. TaxID=1955623 RepID=UPI002B20E5B3|nr:FAD-dependent oxidoreductase [Propionicimonas sp.]MEA4944817.1 FAD-dependent oxidoreductase [Propionicimonas sp.]MEA5118671.1 FAD-dependent oxidoreductase [Propionicimonas sp.]
MSIQHLFTPVTIGSLTLPHRGIMPSMVVNLCGLDGTVTDQFIAYHVARAEGGVALNITEAAYVHPGGKGFPNQLGIDHDGLLPGLRRLTDAVHDAGGRVAVQLFHGGRQANAACTGGTVVAPSPIPCPVMQTMPHELTIAEIHDLVQAFVDAGVRAQQAGFDAIEIHGAHGYLVNQFLSPHTNRRDDEYGRDPAGRARFPLEILDGLRAALGREYPLIYRISANEFLPDGLTVPDTGAFCTQLVEHGIDAINVSGSIYETNRVAGGPWDPLGAFVDDAVAIRKAIGAAVPVCVANRIKTPAFADELIASGAVDLVATGRAVICDPEFYRKAKEGHTDRIRICLSCNYCMSELMMGHAVSCLYNPLAGHESEFDLHRDPEAPKEVVVVGGGMAGMEAAATAASRGNHVRLYEATGELGGNVVPGIRPPFKSEMGACLRYEKNTLDTTGVQVFLDHPVDAGFLAGCGADRIIVATGSEPILPAIPGIDAPWVVTAEQVLLDPAVAGHAVAVIGAGSVGVETAELLSDRGSQVTVIELTDDMLTDLSPTLRAPLEARIRQTPTSFAFGHEVRELRDHRVITQAGDLGPFDTVVIAVGYRANTALGDALTAAGIAFTTIGDAVRPRKISNAVAEGFRAGYAV